MTFLDYKLILLIGLAIVIYFLYYEIKLIKNKFRNIEEKINNKILTNKIYKTKERLVKPYDDYESVCNHNNLCCNYTHCQINNTENNNTENNNTENNNTESNTENNNTENNNTENNITEEIEIYSNDTSNKEIEINNNLDNNNLNNNIELNNKLNNIELNKLKLIELKEIAKNNNIVLIKNNKIKNKQELINDILEKNI